MNQKKFRTEQNETEHETKQNEKMIKSNKMNQKKFRTEQ